MAKTDYFSSSHHSLILNTVGKHIARPVKQVKIIQEESHRKQDIKQEIF
jgi:hypothetical protein